MPIVGHNETLPLLDLVQNKASEPGSHRFTIEGSRGAGLLVLESGMVVHAEYSGKSGEDAALELLTERSTYYLVRSGTESKQHTMHVALGRLLLSTDIPAKPTVPGEPAPIVESGYSGPHSITSMRRADVDRAAEQAGKRRNSKVAEFPAPASASRPPSAEATTSSPAANRMTPVLVAVGAVIVLSAAAFFATRGSETDPSPAIGEPTETIVPFQETGVLEVGALGPRDQAPALLEGAAVPVPAGTTAVLSPTITCRILIGTNGLVQEAEIYRPRSGLAAFEEAALSAVRTYRFEPALIDGRPQAMWINYPVRFEGS